jgi:hypothetical protein
VAATRRSAGGRGRRAACGRPLPLAALALAAAACGGHGGSHAATSTATPATTAAATTAPQATGGAAQPVPVALAAVVRAWSAAINRGDDRAAGALFSHPALVVQAYALRLDTLKDAITWNSGLPCAGRVEGMRLVPSGVLATFTLGERPHHHCDAPGHRAAAVFLVVRGRIRLWQQVAVPDEAPPAGTTTAGVAAV